MHVRLRLPSPTTLLAAACRFGHATARSRRALSLILAVILATVTSGITPAPAPTSAAPELIAAAGSRLVRPGGAPFFVVGANYVGAPDRSWTMWEDGKFDAGLIQRDFARAKAIGVNTVRIFIRSPLQHELAAGRWDKLDAVVAAAEQQDLMLIVTLYDYREDDLSRVAPLDRAIAERYASRSAILAYDLKNEPHYQDLAIARYPGSPPPLQTDGLIKHYGERMKPGDVENWRQNGEGRALVPARFSSQEAYVYANNLLLYRELLGEAGRWVAARGYTVSTLDYLDSPDAAKWQPYIDALSQTLAAWLQPRVDAIRAVDANRLITVGYSDPVLARLAANQSLSFVSIHRFPSPGIAALRGTFNLLDDVRRGFADKPLVFEEFGYATSELEPSVAAQYETALFLQTLTQGLAGAAKWSLYDVAGGANPRENSFGIHTTDGALKPIGPALRALSAYVHSSALPAGTLEVDAEANSPGLRYTYAAPDALIVGGSTFADQSGRLSYDASPGAQVFVTWPVRGRIDVTVTKPTTVRLNPSAIAGSSATQGLKLQRSDGADVPFQQEGSVITFTAEAGQSYQLRYQASALDGRIEILWPHDNKPVSQARLANLTAYLFAQDTTAALCTPLDAPVRLWRSLNNGVEEPVSTGQPRQIKSGDLSFAAWDFNDVDVAAANDPQNKYYFRLTADGYPLRSSIWSHGADARTYLPNPDVPTGIAAAVPQAIDAKIEVVWPHNNEPVTQTTLANISALLFERGTLQSAPVDWSPTVRLWRSVNNGALEPVAVAEKVTKSANGLTYPAFEFNNVDVSAARDPLNKIYFRVTVDGIDSRSNVWSHGADARTYFPQKDTPSSCS